MSILRRCATVERSSTWKKDFTRGDSGPSQAHPIGRCQKLASPSLWTPRTTVGNILGRHRTNHRLAQRIPRLRTPATPSATTLPPPLQTCPSCGRPVQPEDPEPRSPQTTPLPSAIGLKSPKIVSANSKRSCAVYANHLETVVHRRGHRTFPELQAAHHRSSKTRHPGALDSDGEGDEESRRHMRQPVLTSCCRKRVHPPVARQCSSYRS